MSVDFANKIFKNFFKYYFGNPKEISGMGDGTVIGAIKDLNDSLNTWETLALNTVYDSQNFGTIYESSFQRNTKLRKCRIYVRGTVTVNKSGYKNVAMTLKTAYSPTRPQILFASVNGQNAILYANAGLDGQISIGSLNDDFTGSQHVIISGEYYY